MIEALMRRIRRRRMHILKPFGQVPTNVLRLSVGDLSSPVTRQLAVHFQDAPAVEVVQGNLLDLTCDAIVSPANSFGDMSGGIDKAIDDFHGGEAQSRATAMIREHYFGELPVGVALILELPSRRFPFLVVAPTMRIPGSITGSVNAYLAMRAALVAVLHHNRVSTKPIRTLAVSGLGTGVGGLHPEDSANQMRTAYDNIIGGNWKNIVHPIQAPLATWN